ARGIRRPSPREGSDRERGPPRRRCEGRPGSPVSHPPRRRSARPSSRPRCVAAHGNSARRRSRPFRSTLPLGTWRPRDYDPRRGGKGVVRRSVVLGVLAGALAGIGAFTFHYGEGLSSFSTDPRACKNCHIMNDEYASWTKGPHHAVAKCIDCHLPHEFVPKYLAQA